MNFYTAKRLLLALNHFIKEHEATFGTLEIDYNKAPAPTWGSRPGRDDQRRTFSRDPEESAVERSPSGRG